MIPDLFPDSRRTVSVVVTAPLDGPFDYLLPEGRPMPVPGTVVAVPFGRQVLHGVVWDTRPEKAVDPGRLRPLGSALDIPPLPWTLRRLVDHVAYETVSPRGQVLKLALSTPGALEPPRTVDVFTPAIGAAGAKLTAKQRQVVEQAMIEPRTPADLARAAGVSTAVVKKLIDGAALVSETRTVEEAWPVPDPDLVSVTLNEGQAAASDRLKDAVAARRHQAFLLDGVPGSGKTEVYFSAIAACLQAGRRALILLPEIALTSQWAARFARAFGVNPITWHADVGSSRRRKIWRAALEGKVPLVVGARSALWLPLQDLGLIVVDEEHDSSFKQDEGVPYQARDAAIARARFENCPVVLASATPSLETIVATERVGPDRIERLVLPERHGSAPPPPVEIVDLRTRTPRRSIGFLAPRLVAQLRATLERGDQALLFLNRRGYAPLSLCRACGHRFRCPNCSAWLTAHRLRRRLQCHHCGFSMPEPDHCPECGTIDALALSGPGVERIADEVRHLFPKARTALLTSDTATTAGQAAAVLDGMENRTIDILIGTQMVAKGHHFPDLTLVGVVDGDLGLGGGDLRAAERSFQLLYQVAGRAGRAEKPGTVLIQTHLPDHPVMRALASGDRDRFVATEIEERMDGGLPPFGRLASLILSGPNQIDVQSAARHLSLAAPVDPRVRVLGPAPAPIALLRGRWRERLLVQAAPEVDLPAWIRAWTGQVKQHASIQLSIDVDPYDFL
ncbi:MAG TPA: primosomal protein N' [Geminicoccus sp.]|jgi:primosomal protein N' (replication factor Y)|uniref:primosomal protein N' n=1 Tax=Geminicoccus sp. TaxID=2024832 RepID=UPI002E30F7A9|nr:primosomal protein N' [Geminicoccus sp.]HEX2524797.1 primosomal protein N' [Geminicoccus sp.]